MHRRAVCGAFVCGAFSCEAEERVGSESGSVHVLKYLSWRWLCTGFHKEPMKKQKKGDDDEEGEGAAGREARWERIALAATKQSLRWDQGTGHKTFSAI